MHTGIERSFGDPDDMISDELRRFSRAIHRILQAAFPFEHRPSVISIARETIENAAGGVSARGQVRKWVVVSTGRRNTLS
jgi:hypothetical protein